MEGLSTFPRGGIKPELYKTMSFNSKIENASLPAEAVIPLHQHMGQAAECVVAPNDRVKEGMIIGRARGTLSANVHSSIPGIVKEIKEFFLPNGVKTRAVVVELAGEFEQSGKIVPRSKWDELDAASLNNLVADKGIVGLGGMAFPTHVKYARNKKGRLKSLIINGAESEPYLTADYRLMLEKTAEILEGIEIVQKILGKGRVIIGIEENKPEAIAALTEKIKERALAFEIVALAVKYPQGDERMLIKTLLQRDIPGGRRPWEGGVVVSNVATVFAVLEAVVFGKPLIERVLTVTGRAIARPKNLKVRIGTRVSELIEECGGFSRTPAKIVAGGPMMGFTLPNLDMPVTKSMTGLLALTRNESTAFRNFSCIRCARCLKVCPRQLVPTTLHKLIEHGEYGRANSLGLGDCIECGCCAFVCPSEIPLVQSIRLGKEMLNKI